MICFMGSGYGLLLLCPDLAKPFKIWNLNQRWPRSWDIGCKGNSSLIKDLNSVIKIPGKCFLARLTTKRNSVLYALVSPSCLSNLQKGWRWHFESMFCNFCNWWPSSVKLMTRVDSYRVCFPVLASQPLPNHTNGSKTCTIKTSYVHVILFNPWLCFVPF